jgi:tRNA-specific 2-thiouridylase
MDKNKILMAMSGGIDSSVAAMLLREQGYEVVGVTYRIWDYTSASCNAKDKGCCSMDAILEAKAMAEKLGFEHHIIDLRDFFKESVIDHFADEYMAGRTPNPCVDCNSHIKWGSMLEKADELGCYYIATGHYAQVREENGRWILSKGEDTAKDQSYFLWRLSQENLSRTMFPLGKYTKPQIRELAAERGFVKLSKKTESQEICFIQDNNYRNFLKRHVDNFDKKVGPGNFVDMEGKVLGQHKGYPFYTIGQRKGLEIALGHPAYVVSIDPINNVVKLGTRENLFATEMKVGNINMIKYEDFNQEKYFNTKIRYRTPGVDCKVKIEDNIYYAKFNDNVSGVTPGQSAVFYEDNDVVAGGVIIK